MRVINILFSKKGQLISSEVNLSLITYNQFHAFWCAMLAVVEAMLTLKCEIKFVKNSYVPDFG